MFALYKGGKTTKSFDYWTGVNMPRNKPVERKQKC